MAGSVNKVILVGNLGRDPEIRTTQSGVKIVNLAIATSESWNDKASGERQERTEWHRVVIMNEALANVAERYLKKGSKVYVEGKLQTRKWTDQSGQEKYTTEVMVGRINAQLALLDRPAGNGDGGGDYGSGGQGRQGQSQGARNPAPQTGRQPSGGSRGGSWDSGGSFGGGPVDDDIPFAPSWQ